MFKKLSLTSDTDAENSNAADQPSDDSEARMRLALDIMSRGRPVEPRQPDSRPPETRSTGGGSSWNSPTGARRHRFVQDGEVSVVHAALQRDRNTDGGSPASLTDASRRLMAEERAARERAEQAAEKAQATILALQTRLGHAELALRDALALSESREQAIQSLRAQLDEQAAELETTKADLRAAVEDAEAARDDAQELKRRLRETRQTAAPAPRQPVQPAQQQFRLPPPIPKRRSPAVAQEPEVEPEPVKWWLTSEKNPKRNTRRAK